MPDRTTLSTSVLKVAAHVQVAGGRVASVTAAAGSGLDPVSEVLYYHRDMQGSVVATTYRTGGYNGYLGARYRYTPYGQLDRAENVSPSSDSELGYTGGLRLGYAAGVAQQGNLVLLGARVYHAELKRWLVPDTVDGRRYTYVGGDPVNFVDPSGRIRVAAGMAEMYYRLFYGDPGVFGNWNLFVGSGAFSARVDNSIYLVGLQTYADKKNLEPPIYLDGTHWRAFGQYNGYLVADLGNTVVSLAEPAGIPLAEHTMDEQVVNTGSPLGAPPRLPSFEDQFWDMEMHLYRYRPEFPTMEVLGIIAYGGYSSQYRGRLVVKSISNIMSNAKYAWANRRSPADAWVGASGVGVSILEMAGIKTAFVAGWAIGRGIDDFIGKQALWDEYGVPWGVCP